MKQAETVDLLMRMYAIWPNAMPPESRRAAVREEWERLLAKTNAGLANQALDVYAASLAGKYMPKPSEILQVCANLLDEQERRTSLDYEGKCPLCQGKGSALVDAAEPFYGNYGSLGVVCPCRTPREMQALERGLHIVRRVKPGSLEMWLEGRRIWGRLKVFAKKEPEAEPARQQSLGQAFGGFSRDDLPF